jgi:isopenicillin-N N-acyltransferase like protein
MATDKQPRNECDMPNRRQFLGNAGSGLLVSGGAMACGRSMEAQSSPPSPPAKYRLIRVQGTHREMGRQHGEQASEQIRTHVGQMSRSREQLNVQALRFQPLFEKYCPHLLDEITGLAEGARITLAEALAVNIRGELRKASPEGCTTYVISRKGTANREILIGQNSDMGQQSIDLGYILHLKPKDKPQVLIWTFGGMIGYHGMNSAGVAIFENALSERGAVPLGRFAMPHYPVKRMILESSSIETALGLFHRVPLASNKNYVICDGFGAILDIESTTAGPELLKDEGAGFLVHSNHFVCSKYANKESTDDALLPDSRKRFQRIHELIRADFGAITVDRMKAHLSDHSDHPTSICRHSQTAASGSMKTVASMIAEPAFRRMHVAQGNPCSSRYVTYSMDV